VSKIIFIFVKLKVLQTTDTCFAHNEIHILLCMKSFYRELIFRNLTRVCIHMDKNKIIFTDFTVDSHSNKVCSYFTSIISEMKYVKKKSYDYEFIWCTLCKEKTLTATCTNSYKYHVFGHYPSSSLSKTPSCSFFKTQHFGVWILSTSSGPD
jgi:hypothetical protein